MIKKILFAVAAAGAFGLSGAQFAAAAPIVPQDEVLYPNFDACNIAGINATAAAGGPGNLAYKCDVVSWLAPGQNGCPPEAADGCLVEYYRLITWGR